MPTSSRGRRGDRGVDLAERVQRVRLLLDSLNHPYPQPHAALQPDSGPAASLWVPCETCRQRGEIAVRGRWRMCMVCDGRGEHRRGPGDPEWDAYLGMALADAVELPVELVTHQPTSGEPPFAWERLRRTYDRHGSYQELRRQLDALSLRRPRRHWLVRVCLVDCEPHKLDSAAELELDLGVVELALRMRTVRVPGWLIERTDADERRDAIVKLASTGLPAGEIARRLGVPKSTVRKRLRQSVAERRLPGARIPVPRAV